MYHCGMRQVGERHVAYQVELMVWSNRLDLIALSNFRGEVQIHRLQWQKVYSLPPPKENVTVKAMAWRPDGKALAIGYSSGALYIVDIEEKEILNKYELDQGSADEFDNSKDFGITCITWAVRTEILESATEYNLYDDASIFLQKLPIIGGNQSTDDNSKNFNSIKYPSQLNMILVGFDTGNIYMNIFGKYPYGTLNLGKVGKDEFGEYKILNLHLSDDFSIMQVIYLDTETNDMLATVINTSVLSAYAEEIFKVAEKHGRIMQCLSYIDQTMVTITEAWEHILLEMDTKMAYYAASVPDGGVSADLLELLMLGSPSDELQLFLLQKLTTNDLKKFGNSVEMSYSTIQKLVLKQLNVAGQSLTYYLSELRGLTRIVDRYKTLGLEETTVSAAIRACCAFLNKCLELQQVIDVSMRNYKAFFRWLFVVIVRFLDEQIPSEIVKINQQELSYIAEFLYNFDEISAENTETQSDVPIKFNLERLGQYLQDQELTILPDDEDNPWHKFLRENSCLLKDNDTILSMTEFKKFSLVQQQNYLKNAVLNIFDVSQRDTGKYLSILLNIKCYGDQTISEICDNLRISQIYLPFQKRFMMAFINNDGEKVIHFISVSISEKTCIGRAMKYYISSNLLENDSDQSVNEDIDVLDLQFYSIDYLSVVTSHPNKDSSLFMQIPSKALLENSVEFNIKSKSCLFIESATKLDIAPLLYDSYKILDKLDGYRLAVSGGRKVAIVLSRSLRKVRVFEMEIDGEDEEEETLDTTPQSPKSKGTPERNNSNTEDITF